MTESRKADTEAEIQSTSRLAIPPKVLAPPDDFADRIMDFPALYQGEGGEDTDPQCGVFDEEFQELFQSVYDSAIVTRLDGRIVDANRRAVRSLGYTREGFTARSVFDVISGLDESTMEAIRGSLVDRFVLIESCHCLRRDENSFPAEVAVNQIHLLGADFLCFFIRDISIRVRAQEAELRAEDQRVMLESLGAACHHIGQPASVLLAYLEILARGAGDTDPKTSKRLKACREAARSISTILHKLGEVEEYRTTPYLDAESNGGRGTRIVEV